MRRTSTVFTMQGELGHMLVHETVCTPHVMWDASDPVGNISNPIERTSLSNPQMNHPQNGPERPTSIVDLCQGRLQTSLEGNTYCSLIPMIS